MDFAGIAHIFNTEPSAAAEKPIDTLRSMMKKGSVTETDIRKVASDKGHYSFDTPIESYSDKFISGWLIKYWPQVLNLIGSTANNTKQFGK